MGPEDLVHMLLVFGALPRPARTTAAPTQLRRQEEIEDAKKAASHEKFRRCVAFALRHPSSPKERKPLHFYRI